MSRPGDTLYRWFARDALRITFAESTLLAEGYSSQCGQDKWVIETLFPGRTGGIFVDIGANDGVHFSNTLRLEKDWGWTGIAIEPIPEIFALLQKNRTCTVINGCVGRHPGKRKFQLITGHAQMLSGLIAEYDERHVRRINETIAKKGGTRRVIEVNCFTLPALLAANRLASVDYLSIDVEGAELSILRAINWSALDVKVVGIENNYGDYRIPLFLARRGYRLHSIVGDEFYVRPVQIRQIQKRVNALPFQHYGWTMRMQQALAELDALVPNGQRVIIVDQNEWGMARSMRDPPPYPFIEHDGEYWGPPSDDETAIRELERLRRAGANYIVFGWHTFWWLDHYARFAAHLRQHYSCLLHNERLAVFDLGRQ